MQHLVYPIGIFNSKQRPLGQDLLAAAIAPAHVGSGDLAATIDDRICVYLGMCVHLLGTLSVSNGLLYRGSNPN